MLLLTCKHISIKYNFPYYSILRVFNKQHFIKYLFINNTKKLTQIIFSKNLGHLTKNNSKLVYLIFLTGKYLPKIFLLHPALSCN